MVLKNNLIRSFLYFFSKEKSITNSMRRFVEFLISSNAIDEYSSFKLEEITNITGIKSSILTISIRKLIDLSIIDKKLHHTNSYKINNLYAPPTNNIILLSKESQQDIAKLYNNINFLCKKKELKNSHRVILEYIHSVNLVGEWKNLGPPASLCKELNFYTSTFHKARQFLIQKNYIKFEAQGNKYNYLIPEYPL